MNRRRFPDNFLDAQAPALPYNFKKSDFVEVLRRTVAFEIDEQKSIRDAVKGISFQDEGNFFDVAPAETVFNGYSTALGSEQTTNEAYQGLHDTADLYRLEVLKILANKIENDGHLEDIFYDIEDNTTTIGERFFARNTPHDASSRDREVMEQCHRLQNGGKVSLLEMRQVGVLDTERMFLRAGYLEGIDSEGFTAMMRDPVTLDRISIDKQGVHYLDGKSFFELSSREYSAFLQDVSEATGANVHIPAYTYQSIATAPAYETFFTKLGVDVDQQSENVSERFLSFQKFSNHTYYVYDHLSDTLDTLAPDDATPEDRQNAYLGFVKAVEQEQCLPLEVFQSRIHVPEGIRRDKLFRALASEGEGYQPAFPQSTPVSELGNDFRYVNALTDDDLARGYLRNAIEKAVRAGNDFEVNIRATKQDVAYKEGSFKNFHNEGYYLTNGATKKEVIKDIFTRSGCQHYLKGLEYEQKAQRPPKKNLGYSLGY